MKRKFLRVSTMLVLSGLLAFSFVATSCGDDDEEDPVEIVNVPKITNAEVKDGAIIVTGENLPEVETAKVGDVELNVKKEGNTITGTPKDGAELPTGEQTVSIKFKGIDAPLTTKVTIPEVTPIVVNTPEITNAEVKDGAIIITGKNLPEVESAKIGDVDLDVTSDATSITAKAKDGVELPTGEQTVTIKLKGVETPLTTKVTIPEATELAYETPKTITWEGQWAGPSVQVEADWATVTAVFEEKPENVQFCVNSDFVVKEESWGKSYQSTYPQIADATASVDIAAELKTMQAQENDASTKITTITLQYTQEASKDEPYTAKLKALIVTLTDGSKKLVVPTFAWGGSIE